jgi:hypothetical protein
LPPEWWRDRQLLREQLERHGSAFGAANANGDVSARTLTNWVRRHRLPQSDLRARLAQSLARKAAENHARKAPSKSATLDKLDEVAVLSLLGVGRNRLAVLVAAGDLTAIPQADGQPSKHYSLADVQALRATLAERARLWRAGERASPWRPD